MSNNNRPKVNYFYTMLEALATGIVLAFIALLIQRYFQVEMISAWQVGIMILAFAVVCFIWHIAAKHSDK